MNTYFWLLKILSCFCFSKVLSVELHCGIATSAWGNALNNPVSIICNIVLHCIFSHINRRTQFENPVLEAKRRLEQQRQMQSQGLSALPLPTIYRGTTLCAVMSQLHKYDHVQIDLKHFQILPVEEICKHPTSVAVHGAYYCYPIIYCFPNLYDGYRQFKGWVFDGADAQCHNVQGRVEIAGSAGDWEHARPEAPSGLIQASVWGCNRPVHSELLHNILSENYISPMSQLIRN